MLYYVQVMRIAISLYAPFRITTNLYRTICVFEERRCEMIQIKAYAISKRRTSQITETSSH